MALPICYKCGQEMHSPEDVKALGDKVTHEEHILHNALYGKLTSSSILCKTCGSKFGDKEDAEFVKQFEPITERLSSFAISRDHGKSGGKSLSGFIVSDRNSASQAVNIKNGSATPLNPFHKYDPYLHELSIYAQSRKSCRNYEKKAIGELKKQIDTSDIKISHITDMLGEGSELAYKFDLNNLSFKRGFNKIAIGYALHCGVVRDQIPEALKIDNDGIGHFEDKANLIPFSPQGSLDYLYETNRNELESLYPNHTLILFNQQNGDASIKGQTF